MRSPPRSPEPMAGNSPLAGPAPWLDAPGARAPLGSVSRQVPGAVGSAVRTATRTVTLVLRPTTATSGDSDRETVSVRRTAYSDAKLTATTASSSSPK